MPDNESRRDGAIHRTIRRASGKKRNTVGNQNFHLKKNLTKTLPLTTTKHDPVHRKTSTLHTPQLVRFIFEE